MTLQVKIYEGRGSDIARAGSKIIAHCLEQSSAAASKECILSFGRSLPCQPFRPMVKDVVQIVEPEVLKGKPPLRFCFHQA